MRSGGWLYDLLRRSTYASGFLRLSVRYFYVETDHGLSGETQGIRRATFGDSSLRYRALHFLSDSDLLLVSRQKKKTSRMCSREPAGAPDKVMTSQATEYSDFLRGVPQGSL
ncbi:hypothetical protein EVAR_103133_1 [Eumeta japonica]|uniref:Uncharacterized protein n=1 Tax=Eumeta variegata TaxID=151549 RepID=A0A4C1X5P6_EUMVA|nr:hypothetical protein EVAR_103133_1 [Eumeta japonica]